MGLGRYVPGAALRWPGDALAPAPLHRHVDGTLVFVDVSGFTALSERLAQRGKVGAEQLTDVLNAVFGTMLGLAAARGGSLLKFGGDALFLLFTGPDHAVQAACATVEMRSALAATATTPGPAGRLRLRMSVGVHSGNVDLFLVGTSHRELVIVGPATTAVAEMETAASAGQILLSPATASALPSNAVGAAIGSGYLLRWRRPHADTPRSRDSIIAETDVASFVPTAQRRLLSAGDPESEHRTVGVCFVHYTGMDSLLENDGHQAAADALHLLVSAAQDCADAEGVTFLATDLAEDGGKVILVAGFPTTADDDQGRLLRAAHTIVRRSVDEQWPLAVSAGINRGHVFAGAIGSAERATVTVMGDTVNLAARVMAKADPGQVLATPATLDNAQTLFRTEPVEPFMVKGKARPVTAYVVDEETGTRPPRGLGTLPFLGRENELATLTAAVPAWDAELGGVLTVVGEAGTGKTRLLREALSTADGVTTLEARAEPYGATTPYRPVRDPLRELLGLSVGPKDGLAQTLVLSINRLDPTLTPWAPLIGDVLGIPVDPTDTTRDLDPRFRPDRTADVVVRLIAAAVAGPLVVVFDDTHYSDDATAGLAARFERETVHRPWLFLAARRDEDSGYRPTSGATLALTPLSDDTVLALVHQATAAAPLRPDEAETVVSRVAGNPLFLEETLRNLREHGDINALPSSLEGMVAAQIDALPPLARRVVRRASVLGRSFRTPVLRDLLDDDTSLDDATLRELADILEPDGPGRLRFRHALLRDAAYDSLPYQGRRGYHAAAAASTLRRAGNDPEEYSDSLALHYAMAADQANTWHWARVAAAKARAAYANPAAAAQFERALEASRRLPDVSTTEVVATWQALGDVRDQSGQFEASLEAYRQGFRLAADPVTKASLLTMMARARERAGLYSAAHRDVTRAERILQGTTGDGVSVVSASLLSHRAIILLAQNRYYAAETAARTALETARAANDEQSQARALQALSTSRIMLGQGDAAGPASEALTIQQRLGDLSNQSILTGNLGGMAWFEGRWSEAERLYGESADTAERAGNVVQAALARANQGELLVAQGRVARAVTVLTDAIATLQAVGYTEGAAFARTQLGRIRAVSGEVDDARAILEELVDQLTQTHPALAVDPACALAELEVDAGRPAIAVDILDAALRAVDGEAGVYAATELRVRARALIHLGRLDEADAVVANGTATAEAAGLDYEHALLGVASAELSLARGEPVDRPRLEAVMAALEALGVTSERIASLAAAVGR